MTDRPSEPPDGRPPEDRPSQDGPPADPPGNPPPVQWQQPGQYHAYPAPYDRPQPAPGQNPYGGDTVSYYQPIDSGGMSTAAKVVLGGVIGLLAGGFLWFFTAIVFLGADADSFLLLSAVAPLLVPAPLLIWKATRPWAVGILIGTAIVSIGLAGLCSWMITDLNGGTA